jgi:hypothetical protein
MPRTDHADAPDAMVNLVVRDHLTRLWYSRRGGRFWWRFAGLGTFNRCHRLPVAHGVLFRLRIGDVHFSLR